ncbi:MAG TPA: PilN domain-containing protein [Solirubrobacterales bacterium]|nr:PilN domain-containing protein [Solirubrobacterales bacterium]
MRPVNLIPPEQRHGSESPLRTGPLPYLVLGGLVALLIGVALLVVTNNQISERKSEIVTLKHEDRLAQKKAERLASYVQLAQLRQQRTETVNSLADSRFDWERVMRELSKVLPSNVWLTTLNASASPEAASNSSSEGSGSGGLRSSVAGPALEIGGCADGQDGVAGFVTALKEIDGVTRVGVESSALPSGESSSESGEGSEGGGESDCRTRDFIAQFQLVVAFDAAPVPATAEATAVEATAATTEATESTEATEESSGG